MQGYTGCKEPDKHDTTDGKGYNSSNQLQRMENQRIAWKRFKIIILKMINEMKENAYRQLNRIRIKKHEQNEKFNQEIETTEKEPNITGHVAWLVAASSLTPNGHGVQFLVRAHT